MIKYSIITVTWNDLSGLKNTFESINRQHYDNYEWIVIDGASKDGTKDWLKSLPIGSCTWISEPDKGIFDAMNKGIKKASGDFLIYMNSGDSFYNESTLEEVSNKIMECTVKPLFIYGDAIDITSDNIELYKKANHYKTYTKTMFTSHQAMFFNRDFGETNSIKYPLEYKITADYAYISLYFNKINEDNKIIYLNFPFCKFLLGGTNETQRFKALKEDFRIRTKIMRMNIIKAFILFLLHYMHTIMKRILPSITRKLKYQ